MADTTTAWTGNTNGGSSLLLLSALPAAFVGLMVLGGY